MGEVDKGWVDDESEVLAVGVWKPLLHNDMAPASTTLQPGRPTNAGESDDRDCRSQSAPSVTEYRYSRAGALPSWTFADYALARKYARESRQADCRPFCRNLQEKLIDHLLRLCFRVVFKPPLQIASLSSLVVNFHLCKLSLSVCNGYCQFVR
jgi:hypothetical protein